MPVMLDLFCGLGGASRAMRERGWTVIGVDSEPAVQPDVLANVAGYHYDGPPVDLLWASPPCTEFARRDMPFHGGRPEHPPSLVLLGAALRVRNEVRPRFWLLENVRGARRFFRPILGEPIARSGSVYIWGNVPNLALPTTNHKHKWKASMACDDDRIRGLPFNQRRALKRARIPLSVGEAVATRVEELLA